MNQRAQEPMSRLQHVKCECGRTRKHRQVASLDEAAEIADQLTAKCKNCGPQAKRAALSRLIDRSTPRQATPAR